MASDADILTRLRRAKFDGKGYVELSDTEFLEFIKQVSLPRGPHGFFEGMPIYIREGEHA